MRNNQVQNIYTFLNSHKKDDANQSKFNQQFISFANYQSRLIKQL